MKVQEFFEILCIPYDSEIRVIEDKDDDTDVIGVLTREELVREYGECEITEFDPANICDEAQCFVKL